MQRYNQLKQSFIKKRVLYLIAILTIISVHQQLFSQNKNIEITYQRNDDKSIDIFYTKELPGSYLIKLDFTTLTNCYEPNIEKVVKNSSGTLVKLRPSNSENHITFGYKYSTIRGNPNPKVDSLFTYVLPLLARKKVRVNEASNLGEKYFGSKRPKNWKSYIIYRNSPDTICSMRKGIVVQITNKHEGDTLYKKSYTSKRNTITIEHADGTFSSYAGFNKNSMFVKLGQTVYPQTKLGALEIFNTGKYRLSFSIYYIIDTNFDDYKKENLKTKKSRSAFLTPYFLTENGIEQLKSRNDYTVTSNETVLLEEFSRREKKNYKKNPQLFH